MKIHSGGGRRSASLWEVDELNEDRRREAGRGRRALGERNEGERWCVRYRPARAGSAEYTVIGLRVTARVVVVARVHEELRGETFRADLNRERPVARGHEACWNERARGERQQHDAGDQLAHGLVGQLESHGPCSLVLRRRP